MAHNVYSAVENPSFGKNPQLPTVVVKSKAIRVIVAVIAILLAGTALIFHLQPPAHKVRGVILMVSDGFGPASQTLARNYRQQIGRLHESYKLPLDTILVGSSRTRSSSSLVTDSAAGATAFACGLKSYNGAIAVDALGNACGTVLEAAKERGMITGLVVTSRITHGNFKLNSATPAVFAAHSASRVDENGIAMQMIGNYSLGRRVDLLYGGGDCYFRPNTSAGSCREDSNDVYAIAKDLGWNVGSGIKDFGKIKEFFVSLTISLPQINLFAKSMMSYEIDRESNRQPSLKEMSAEALSIIDRESKRLKTGFFIMIEGSRIDMAAHSNDPATHLRDILAYNDAIEYVKSFVDDNDDVVMVSVSDHETGGLSDSSRLDPAYAWYPFALEKVKHSGEYIAETLRIVYEQPAENIREFVRDTVLVNWLGITKPGEADLAFLSDSNNSDMELEYKIGEITTIKANLGWATYGHSAVDVNLYAYGINSNELAGNHENTEIGDFISRNLGLNLKEITDRLALDQNMRSMNVEPIKGDYRQKGHH